MTYAIIDIETTGGSPKSSKITEIAIYKHDGKHIIDQFITLINPETIIPPFISQLTGINNEMVEKSPKFYEIAKHIVEFTKDCIFVAHNVGFDYGVIRSEFKALGYDYRRRQLCTVRASRYILPKKKSYSLGKLTHSLGIELVDRHRAGGDAYATAQLFTLLMKTDVKGLSTFIQEEVNPKRLHPSLDLDTLEELPNKVGVYQFFNDVNQLIYIGKSIHLKKRVEQHLRNNKTKKGIQMQGEIARIEYELCGSELIALLRESALIKQHKPLYNRALRKNKFPYGLFQYTTESGYIHFVIAKADAMSTSPITNFHTKKDGSNYLERMVEKYQLCPKRCNLEKTQGACFKYTIKECLGACVQREEPETYNERCKALMETLSFDHQDFYVVDKGRHRGERSLIFIKKGSLYGMGYAPYHFNSLPPKKWDRFIHEIQEDRDARTILRLFLRKNEKHDIVYVPS